MADQTLRKPSISVTPEKYQALTQQYTPKPTISKNVVRAFIVGGIICSIGQLFINFFITLGMVRVEASTAATATMIFLGALLTGLGVYDEIGKFAGAGSIVPVTGFANSIVAPAMEFRREGYVMGVGAKLFTVAGPVLVYGIATSIVVGFVYFFLH
ncbi:stage V sporulation protein AC [Desulfosporosinus sp.]|uniref:stage V sporulation protein AC n=1 Tax=Desulfosporosinus sp. TaxID=157907 RepID=UPI000E888253|nr:stage V sporulation protein AC [Desulfosporosinus sp.]MBC2723116.1 stage V sporulation protein AC [Desulfosporosinus sp.]MBC2726823.1 stage V sporulation protein AC [Desulfosporosinus sp.]HBV89101.1 stage V sporulation protein AC [Desulfosporosinus sp.]